MECYACGEKINSGYLCKRHAGELKGMLEKEDGKIANPDWKHHCLICGEHKDRIIIEYPSAGYFCDRDINEAWEHYKCRE
jgi:hypothetical protein